MATLLDLYNGVSIIPELYWRKDALSFSADACLTGCGGLVFGEYFHVKFLDFILSQDLPIPALELLAITVANKTWAKKLEGLHLIVLCDNDASVHAINHKCSHNKFMQHCLRELWLYLSLYNISLHAKHIPGATNTLADHLSHWHLHPNYKENFYKLTQDMKLVDISVPDSIFKFDID